MIKIKQIIYFFLPIIAVQVFLILIGNLSWEGQFHPIPIGNLNSCRNDGEWSIDMSVGMVMKEINTYKFNGNGAITRKTCFPGVLIIDAEGKMVGGAGPKIGISIGDRTLYTGSVIGNKKIAVKYNTGGLLSIHYLNDYYRSESRLVNYSNLRFSNIKCRTPKVDLVLPNLGYWDETTLVGALVSELPVHINVCGPGNLSFSVSGFKVDGKYPIVELISENGSEKKLIDKINETVSINFKTAGVLTLRLLNPYNLEIADRNLFVKNISICEKRETSQSKCPL